LDEKWAKDLLRDERVRNVLCGYLVNRGVDPREAPRRVEEAVLEAWNRLTGGEKDYTDYGHFRSAVIKTARNYLVDQHRRSQHERPLGDVAERLAAPGLGLRAWSWLVRECLDLLPENERQQLLWEFEDGLTLKELADEMLPPDERTDNARRLEIWRRRNKVLERLKGLMLARGFVPPAGLDEEDRPRRARPSAT